jgi:mono/diheme cytochrome c family protein
MEDASMTSLSKIALAASAAVLLAPLGAAAQEEVVGEHDYMQSCAVCHGPEGKGQGTFSPFLSKQMPDLTQLAKRNHGVFPFDDVYRIIDGRADVKAHGGRMMPVWGKRYTEIETPYVNRDAADEIVRGRVLGLAQYLYLIQGK